MERGEDGTSKDMRDNWCIGYTSRYTVGVWVGNFSGAPMQDVSGVTGAAPIWRDVVQWLHAADASVPAAAPAGVARRTVAFLPAVESARDEWFVRGTEMEVVRSGQDPENCSSGELAGATPRIRYPAAGAVIALDPDIPDAAQRVVFEAAPAIEGLRWRLDSGAVEKSRRGRADWAPASGRHTLALEDAMGKALSSVAFEVRGNSCRTKSCLRSPRGAGADGFDRPRLMLRRSPLR